ncbi:hypothetical protein CRUP_029314 [Coryphaenoides rupestris]|nr:hypothetical protein CRUP_029314 [Coryphaenoides rupestris]
MNSGKDFFCCHGYSRSHDVSLSHGVDRRQDSSPRRLDSLPRAGGGGEHHSLTAPPVAASPLPPQNAAPHGDVSASTTAGAPPDSQSFISTHRMEGGVASRNTALGPPMSSNSPPPHPPAALNAISDNSSSIATSPPYKPPFSHSSKVSPPAPGQGSTTEVSSAEGASQTSGQTSGLGGSTTTTPHHQQQQQQHRHVFSIQAPVFSFLKGLPSSSRSGLHHRGLLRRGCLPDQWSDQWSGRQHHHHPHHPHHHQQQQQQHRHVFSIQAPVFSFLKGLPSSFRSELHHRGLLRRGCLPDQWSYQWSGRQQHHHHHHHQQQQQQHRHVFSIQAPVFSFLKRLPDIPSSSRSELHHRGLLRRGCLPDQWSYQWSGRQQHHHHHHHQQQQQQHRHVFSIQAPVFSFLKRLPDIPSSSRSELHHRGLLRRGCLPDQWSDQWSGRQQHHHHRARWWWWWCLTDQWSGRHHHHQARRWWFAQQLHPTPPYRFIVFSRTTDSWKSCNNTQGPGAPDCDQAQGQRREVSGCLIAIGVLAALLAVFVASTVVLCTRRPGQKYRLDEGMQFGMEMVCISALSLRMHAMPGRGLGLVLTLWSGLGSAAPLPLQVLAEGSAAEDQTSTWSSGPLTPGGSSSSSRGPDDARTAAPPGGPAAGALQQLLDFLQSNVLLLAVGASALLLVLLLAVCGGVLWRRRRRNHVYYPASFPSKMYVERQDKVGGGGARFHPVPPKTTDPPEGPGAGAGAREPVVDSGHQLQQDIMKAARSLRTPNRHPAPQGGVDTNATQPGGPTTADGAGLQLDKGPASTLEADETRPDAGDEETRDREPLISPETAAGGEEEEELEAEEEPLGGSGGPSAGGQPDHRPSSQLLHQGDSPTLQLISGDKTAF